MLNVYILDPHGIYCSGLVASLATLDRVSVCGTASTPHEAMDDHGLAEADIVIVDHEVQGGIDFIRRLSERGAVVVVCSARCGEDDVMEAVQAGAVGVLSKDTLTGETLSACVLAAANGAGVMAPELLGRFLRNLSRVSRDVLEPNGLSLSRLSTREQEVLRLVAEGHPTREVAQRLCYSERTIKNVLHDVTMKLNVRTRSQAVAQAVREGLI
jgi:DNA-binding NarL/FixJ family response regulator